MNTQKKIVVKLGSSITTTENGDIDTQRLDELAVQTKQLLSSGIGVIFVISGSVSSGNYVFSEHSTNTISPQLAAGMGQAFVIDQVRHCFQNHSILTAQMLLTRQDLYNGKTNETVKHTLDEGLKNNIVFILNENDVLELNSFLGNDFLASEIACLLHASYLLLLTDVEGIYGANMEIIKEFHPFETIKLAELTKKPGIKSIGGIQTKIQAAQKAALEGIDTFIANGKFHSVITDIVFHGEHRGTRFINSKNV